MSPDWLPLILDQLRWHWDQQLRPRLDRLSDDGYFWKPVPDCWSVRRNDQSRVNIGAGSGAFTIDFAHPEPDPHPVTTIAWRLGHLIVGVLGARISSHLGSPAVDYLTFDYPPPPTRRSPNSTPCTAFGPAVLQDSRSPISNVPVAQAKAPSPTNRWPRSSFTSTGRSSTTAPKSPSSGTSTPGRPPWAEPTRPLPPMRRID